MSAEQQEIAQEQWCTEKDQAKSQMTPDTVLKSTSHTKRGSGMVFYTWRSAGFVGITAVTLCALSTFIKFVLQIG